MDDLGGKPTIFGNTHINTMGTLLGGYTQLSFDNMEPLVNPWQASS